AVRAIQHALNEALLKLLDGFVEQDASLHHLRDKSFQLVLHVGTLQEKMPRFGAALLVQFASGQDAIGLPVLGARCGDNIGRQFGARRGFRPLDAFQVVAYKLLVERWLSAAGLVPGGGPEARGIRRERLVNPEELVVKKP